jgi:hypothetical protein
MPYMIAYWPSLKSSRTQKPTGKTPFILLGGKYGMNEIGGVYHSNGIDLNEMHNIK